MVALPSLRHRSILWSKGSFISSSRHHRLIILLQAWFSNFHPEKIPSAIERYEKEVHRIVSVVEKHLEGKEYFVGNKYSIVDINNYVWLINVPWLLNDYQTAFEKYPNTGAYVKRLGEHKGIKEAYAEKAA